MLAVDLYSTKDVLGRKVQHLACLRIAYDWWIGNCAIDSVLARSWAMASHHEGHLCTVSEYMLEDSSVDCPSLVPQRLQCKHMSQAFDDCRFARTPSTHKHVQIRIEAECSSVQEAPLPPNRDQLRMLLWRRLAVQPDARAGIEKRLPQALDADLGHLDPAGRRWIGEIVRSCHVPSIHHRDGEVPFGRVRSGVVRGFDSRRSAGYQPAIPAPSRGSEWRRDSRPAKPESWIAL